MRAFKYAHNNNEPWTAHSCLKIGEAMSKYDYQVLFFPGKKLPAAELSELVAELQNVAAKCFCEVPRYQALSGQKHELDRAVMCLARDQNGNLVGFCSALALPIAGHGSVLHLGLTCVHPDARGQNLTHHLTSKMLLNYLLRQAPFKGTWISNCACVLSSLGNVAMYFESLYPSPYGIKQPSQKHIRIAKSISEQHRQPIAINAEAQFDLQRFVFAGSINGTVFEKDGDDERFHHRDDALTGYYQDLLNFDNGDEALQIGRVSLMTFPKYILRKGWNKFKQIVPKPRKSPNYAS